MDIHGTIMANLQGAITSASRLRGKPVYPDTLTHWTGVLDEARKARTRTDGRDLPTLDALVARLEIELGSFQPDPSEQP